jgi:hypothetical protein
MAQFEGTIEEFMRYIGPHARIMVWNITQKHRKKIGKCEECDSTSKLEAAHVKGKERPLLIANILSQFKEDEVIRIDLNEFEERFIEAHLPIESTIRILCNSCHKKYDNLNQIHEIVSEEIDVKNTVDSNKKTEEEAKIIEKLIDQQQMNKTKAINILYNKNQPNRLTNDNTIFSNINAAKDVWWLEPNNEKFKNDLHFILNNPDNNTLYHFFLPSNSIINPERKFQQRKDKNASKIYIDKSKTKFISDKGFDFGKFLIDSKEY